MITIKNELTKHGINENANIEVIREQNGIGVYAISLSDKHFVLKFFEKDEFKREIEYYTLLEKLNIKTIRIISSTDSSLLMEHINYSSKYRLGTKDDFQSPEVVKALALWYKDLHSKGNKYLVANKEKSFYSEYRAITKSSIENIISKFQYPKEVLVSKTLKVLNFANEYLESNRTLTYNDFYFVNMIVAKDLSEAFMFDYNFLGEGLRSADYRNVTHWFNDELKALFLDTYGDIPEVEFDISNVLGTFVDLVQALMRPEFPDWAEEALEHLMSGNLEKGLDEFIVKYNI